MFIIHNHVNNCSDFVEVNKLPFILFSFNLVLIHPIMITKADKNRAMEASIISKVKRLFFAS